MTGLPPRCATWRAKMKLNANWTPHQQHRSVRALLAMRACVPNAHLFTLHPDRLVARSYEALASGNQCHRATRRAGPLFGV